MTERSCSIDGCGKKFVACGWCQNHYYRWRKHGDPTAGGIRRGSNATCSIEGCGRSHKAHGWCEMHWDRMKRSGTTDPPQPRIRICSIDDCARVHWALSYCRLHYKRFLQHGDPNMVVFAMRYGDDIGYEAVHAQLKRYRGRASDYNCVDCSGQAHDWSYDNRDCNERTSPTGLKFSTDLAHYEPRCKPCHKTFDNTQRDSNTGVKTVTM